MGVNRRWPVRGGTCSATGRSMWRMYRVQISTHLPILLPSGLGTGGLRRHGGELACRSCSKTSTLPIITHVGHNCNTPREKSMTNPAGSEITAAATIRSSGSSPSLTHDSAAKGAWQFLVAPQPPSSFSVQGMLRVIPQEANYRPCRFNDYLFISLPCRTLAPSAHLSKKEKGLPRFPRQTETDEETTFVSGRRRAPRRSAFGRAWPGVQHLQPAPSNARQPNRPLPPTGVLDCRWPQMASGWLDRAPSAAQPAAETPW